MDFLDRKITEYRRRAEEYERDGVTAAARMYARIADELEEEARAHGAEELTVADAAKLSGYDESAIRKMRNDGRIPHGPTGGILRRDVPRKPGHGVTRPGPRAVARGQESPADALGARILSDMHHRSR